MNDTKTKFKPGDKVKIRKDLEVGKKYNMENDPSIDDTFVMSMKRYIGKTVTISGINYGKYIIKEDPFYCWTDQMFDEQETIIIYRKNNKVIALDKSTGNKAEAKCHPDDKFIFEIGARLAFNRLFGRDPFEKKDYFTGKVVCIYSDNEFTTPGKIYTFNNGYSIDDDGDRMPAITRCMSVEHLNNVLNSDFIQIIE